MGKFALANALAVAALLMSFPASAEVLKPLPTNPELLTPSPNNATVQGLRIVGYACGKVLFISPMAEAADLVGEVVTEGSGKFVKFIVKVMTKGAETSICDALVMEPAKPQLDTRKPPDFTSTRPTIYEQITGSKAPQQARCSPDQFYSLNGQVCVSLQVSPICTPGQSSASGQCIDLPSLAAPK